MTEFEAAYQKRVVPILRRHNLVEFSGSGPAALESSLARSSFIRLLAVESPAEFLGIRRALLSDPAFQKARRVLGAIFNPSSSDGLIDVYLAIHRSPAGSGKQVVAGSGQGHWRTYGIPDGLPHNRVSSIVQDREGALWFGTEGAGVCRYDGDTYTTFTEQDGLANNRVRAVFQDREGALWFGTSNGVNRYDGERFTIFNRRDGLAQFDIQSIYQDRKGTLWFGHFGHGVTRYDGETFAILNHIDGLASGDVWSIFQDREGALWFGTKGGVSRYDGESIVSFTTEDGLAHNDVGSICQDREGALWFGTRGGGISRYNGKTFTTITSRDGLAHNDVLAIQPDQEGLVWCGTNGGGVTRYRPPTPVPPPVSIDAVLADRRHERVSEIAIPSTVALTTFEFHGTSFKTRPEAMVYRYRLKGYQEDWKTTRERRMEYHSLPRGTYTFQVQAVDRDLVYSEAPATATLTVHLPYERIGWMSALGISILLIGWQSVRVILRDRRLQVANAELSAANEEIRLQTERKSAFFASMAHELRTPMNAIKGFTGLIMRRAGDHLPERQQQNLQKVDLASDHLLNIINDLMDLSKIEAGQMDVNLEDFDVASLVSLCRDTVSPLAEQKNGLELVQDVKHVGQVHTDRQRLQQVLINLLSNAIKFTDSGRVTVRAFREGVDLVLAVEDTGQGIPSDELQTIFEEYRQVKGRSDSSVQKGTGLGLSITKKFAELLGGSISVESEVGKGSTFAVGCRWSFRSSRSNTQSGSPY